VRAAAARHAISQPALTKPILRLEDDIGAVLLNAPSAWRDAHAYGRTLLRHRPQPSGLALASVWELAPKDQLLDLARGRGHRAEARLPASRSDSEHLVRGLRLLLG